eukprot:756522-Hanusia_phi.AAC.1
MAMRFAPLLVLLAMAALTVAVPMRSDPPRPRPPPPVFFLACECRSAVRLRLLQQERAHNRSSVSFVSLAHDGDDEPMPDSSHSTKHDEARGRVQRERRVGNNLSRSKSRCLREFERWAQKHSKVYADAPTYRRRLEAFCMSLKEVEQINSRPGITWTAALNQYSDMTWAEFKSAKLMAEQNCSATITTPVEELVKMGIVADEFDWRNQTCGETSCVSMVKNQGTCGSCWTFSTAAALESLHAIKTGKMVLLSEQQLVDCAADFKNHGCNGGLPSQAFEYVMYNGGLSKMEDYPYVCGDGHCNVTGGPCAFDPAGKPWSVGATVGRRTRGGRGAWDGEVLSRRNGGGESRSRKLCRGWEKEGERDH